MEVDDYKKALQADATRTVSYYNKSLATKTEQQKVLEQMLLEEGRAFEMIADVACGGGSLTFHLRKLFPDARFVLVDYNEDALDEARRNNPDGRTQFYLDSIYELGSQPDDTFDLVCCWQTLSWLDDPASALRQLIRITRPGGRLFVSSLFNLDHDVDLYTKVHDHTRASGAHGLAFNYNTYSRHTVETWVNGLVAKMSIVPFSPGIDLEFSGRGIGTSTIRTDTGTRLQVSAGLLLNWGILTIEK
jgi:ubiquinone/menaquinone biosynthesis C-methylase UbiE